MAKGARKGGRVRDKWRDKQWVIVNKPSGFEPQMPINFIPVTDPTQIKGRTIENTLHDMMKGNPDQSMDQHQIKIFIQIDRITDGAATTIFKGHEYAKEFLRSLIRRGSSMVTFIHDYTTVDGHTFRVAMITFTQRRVNSSKKHEIRLIAQKILADRIPQMTIDQFIQEITWSKGEDIPRETNSKLGANILNEIKKITAIRHVGIKKTKLISTAESRAVSEAKTIESAAPAQ
ncbi:MAG: 40S ribosomal protein S3a/S1 [Nitrososphaeraceae archaeon]|jgi:small subunit ribosomal protein S3Ae|nr:40S ribosomal protein S3a/S1 [Nitrososphaeraceae archaeon]MDW0140379.1 40S ribosomal protein S3a/S1 [Nitrososphaeraceae archaeon]